MRTLPALPSIVALGACALLLAACGTGPVPGASSGAGASSSTSPSISSGGAAPAPADKTTLPPQASANPAEWSCTHDFLGTPSFGNGVSGGGWTDPAQEVFTVLVPCTFADGSSIDAFGLWYHANGTIRGADLAPLFAYQPGDQLPEIYSAPRR